MANKKAKDFKTKTTEAEKCLKFCSYPEVDIKLGSDLIIYDRLPHKTFGPEYTGNIIYMQSTKYLQYIGLTGFINDLLKNNKAQYERY